MIPNLIKAALQSALTWLVGGVVSIGASIKFAINFLGGQ